MEEFTATVWDYYRSHARPMPWRENLSFYNVLVSEMMLQQTQVPRVIPKFTAFMAAFPTIDQLAAAPLATVLGAWVGLGYNRRAKYLHDASKLIVAQGEPQTVDELVKLPGIGKNTAAAIMNYAYNLPVPFVETNIRTVYIAAFFAEQTAVTDAAIMEKVAATLDPDNPREWFWALMDYGSYLKAQGLANLAKSRHHRVQPPLQGSIRQMRGWIVAALAAGDIRRADLERQYASDDRFEPALRALKIDGLVAETAGMLYLTK